MRHDQTMLRDYLVAEVEDPRLNVQSILTRHFLIEALCDRRFADLMKRELEFAVVMNWLLQLAKDKTTAEDFASILHGLKRGADDVEGIKIPGYVTHIFASLPNMAVPDYITPALQNLNAGLDTFQSLWQTALAGETPRKISVLEPACGSANDYRFIESYGIARMLDCHGFDLCEKNITNAKQMFPTAHFEVGNVFEIQAPDKSYDYCLVHDLFEHLSIAGMETAIAEICRVTGEGICAGFFSMHEGEDHLVREVDDYHWNTLSLEKVGKLFTQKGFSIQVIQIETFLKWRLGCEQTHNQNACTLILRK